MTFTVADLEGDLREPQIPPLTGPSSDDRLNGALLPGWKTKKTAQLKCLSINLDRKQID